jgi:hypothetical protein
VFPDLLRLPDWGFNHLNLPLKLFLAGLELAEHHFLILKGEIYETMNVFVFVCNLLKPIFTFLRRLGSQQDYGYRMITGVGFGAVFV